VTDDSAVYLHVTIQLVRGKHRLFAALQLVRPMTYSRTP
jgi:hypothetical protein